MQVTHDYYDDGHTLTPDTCKEGLDREVRACEHGGRSTWLGWIFRKARSEIFGDTLHTKILELFQRTVSAETHPYG